MAVVRIKKVDAAFAMVPLVADADPIVAHVARNGLASLNAVSALLAGLDQGLPQITAGCLVALQQIHTPEVVDELTARLPKIADLQTKKLYLSALCRLCLREADWDGRWWGTRAGHDRPLFQTRRLGIKLPKSNNFCRISSCTATWNYDFGY